jgi:heat shock protein HslJ
MPSSSLPLPESVFGMVAGGTLPDDVTDISLIVQERVRPIHEASVPFAVGLESIPFPDKSALINAMTGRDSIPVRSTDSTTLLVSGEGIVRFIEMDGGFYGIITTNGENYKPDNLPDAMKISGKWIRFEGVVRASATDNGDWGTPISLISVNIPSEGFSDTGTVRFIELEGGFFGIITPEGNNYLPLNLPQEFQVDSIQVIFTAHEEQNGSTTMWGIPIRIDSISRFGQQNEDIAGLWSLLSLNGKPLLPGTEISAFFNNGRITGTTGCNQYFGSYMTNGHALDISAIGSTGMNCASPKGNMDQEEAYLQILSRVDTWSLVDKHLMIRDASGREILIFVSGLAHEPSTLIDYSRTGGTDGFDDHLSLTSNGSGTVTRNGVSRPVNVPEPVMRFLISHIVAADFPSLNDRYPASQEAPLFITYTLTCDGKTVVVEENAIPFLLVPIINILDGIVEGNAPGNMISIF